MKKIVIASACRTAIGKFGGTLANVPAAELGSIVNLHSLVITLTNIIIKPSSAKKCLAGQFD